ncbi:MAG: asparaginase [Limisphaerales bacterium]
MAKTASRKTTRRRGPVSSACGHALLAEVFRGGIVESRHYGSVAVVDQNGKLLYFTGHPKITTFFRSASKPFQVLALLEAGGIKRYGFTPEEIAIMAGSHSGQTEHIEVIDRILGKIGIGEADLQCGVQTPLFLTLQSKTPEPGQKFDQRHHNCSGKHSGMIALAKLLGEDISGYLNPKSKTQRRIMKGVAEACRIPVSKMVLGTDGCLAPNPAVPLYNMAWGFARLAIVSQSNGKFGKAMQPILEAMTKHPLMVSGEKRLDYLLAQTFSGKVVAKAGAEAVECFGLTDRGWGVAVKIEDGSSRGMAPVVFSILKQLGYKFSKQELAGYVSVPVKNYRQTMVGKIEAAVELERWK